MSLADQIKNLAAERYENAVKKVVQNNPHLSDEDLAVKVMKDIWEISPEEPREKDEVFLGNVVMVQKCREMLAG